MEEQKNSKILHSEILKWIIVAVMGFVAVVFIFGAGMWVGTKKAEFSYRWAENYHKNFAGPRMGFMDNVQRFPAGEFVEGHGSVGKIIKIDKESFAMQDKDNTEKIILVKTDTSIKSPNGDLKMEDLKVDDFVVVVGSPNDVGQIEAKMIRILPQPPLSMNQFRINN